MTYGHGSKLEVYYFYFEGLGLLVRRECLFEVSMVQVCKDKKIAELNLIKVKQESY